MEFQKIINFIGTTSDNKDLPTFVTKKWIEVYDQSEEIYNVNKEIRIKKSILRSDLCDFSDAYIVVKANITATKKTFTVNDIDAQQTMQLLLILQMIMHLVIKNWFLKIMHHLSIVFQKLMV